MDLREIGITILLGIGILILIAVAVVIFTFAWNEVMPYLLGLPPLDYWKTIMLWLVMKGLLDLGRATVTIKR